MGAQPFYSALSRRGFNPS